MSILLKPVITEKMTSASEKFNRYGFLVERTANKVEISKAVKEMYNVEVVSVNTMNYAGKARSRFTKAGVLHGRTNAFKKAIVTLAEGETIDFYSQV